MASTDWFFACRIYSLHANLWWAACSSYHNILQCQQHQFVWNVAPAGGSCYRTPLELIQSSVTSFECSSRSSRSNSGGDISLPFPQEGKRSSFVILPFVVCDPWITQTFYSLSRDSRHRGSFRFYHCEARSWLQTSSFIRDPLLPLERDSGICKITRDITRFSPRIDRIFPGEALNPFFGAQDEGFLKFRSR